MISLYPNYYQVVKYFRYAQKYSKHACLNYLENSLEYLDSTQSMMIMLKLLNALPPIGKKEIIKIYIRTTYPNISNDSLEAILIILVYFNTLNEFITTNDKLLELTGFGIRKIQYITNELHYLEIIDKHTGTYFNGLKKNNSTLSIKVKLLKELISFINKKKPKFLANYLETKTITIKDLEYKTALFTQVHDIDNFITIKSYKINYDEETSWFLEKLNTDDIIIFTPQIFVPNTRSYPKLPMNLKIFKKAPLPTFIAKFGEIEETNHRNNITSRRVRFNDVYSINIDTSLRHAWHDLRPENKEVNLPKNLEPGDYVHFEAKVEVNEKGDQWLDKIINIRNACYDE